MIGGGKHSAHKLLRARILLKADASQAGDAWTDDQIAEGLDTSLVRGSGVSAGRDALSDGRCPMIVIAAVAQHGPRDARQLGGECNHHNVRVGPCE